VNTVTKNTLILTTTLITGLFSIQSYATQGVLVYESDEDFADDAAVINEDVLFYESDADYADVINEGVLFYESDADYADVINEGELFYESDADYADDAAVINEYDEYYEDTNELVVATNQPLAGDAFSFEKTERYNRIYNACLLDKSSSVDMQVYNIEMAVIQTCLSIAKNPSWFERFWYD
jgi:hypothetical protein